MRSRRSQIGSVRKVAPILEALAHLDIPCPKSGPVRGDQQADALIAEEALAGRIIYIDPLPDLRHEVNVKACPLPALSPKRPGEKIGGLTSGGVTRVLAAVAPPMGKPLAVARSDGPVQVDPGTTG